jgi:hypothetical protein
MMNLSAPASPARSARLPAGLLAIVLVLLSPALAAPAAVNSIP